jgi:isopenicillin N synthase-like dioxygenase
MDNVPVIDISGLPGDRVALTSLDRACREWGFFQIVGHGVPVALINALHWEMRRFFAQPAEAKQAIVRTADNAWGFFDHELTKNVRDCKEIFDVGPAETTGPLAGSTPQWPTDLTGFKETILEHYGACESVGQRLVEAISLNLGMPANHLDGAFKPKHTSFLRLNYYPECDDAAPADAPSVPTSGQLGINRHTDAGAVTVLLQDDQPGLQVFRDETWHTIEPLAGAFVINIGDIVQVWSNNQYQAPLHRVLASGSDERYSAPFFYNPSYDTNYAPLSGVLDVDPPCYRPINWGEFRAGRAAGDYADYGQEIQISHFAI